MNVQKIIKIILKNVSVDYWGKVTTNFFFKYVVVLSIWNVNIFLNGYTFFV